MKIDLKSGINVQIIDWSKLNEEITKDKLESYNKTFTTDWTKFFIDNTRFGFTEFI